MVKGSVGSQGPWRDGRDLDAAWRKLKLGSFIAREESGLEDVQAESQRVCEGEATWGREDTGTLRQGLLRLRMRTCPDGPCGLGHATQHQSSVS